MKTPSQEQLVAINRTGRFVLHACPGSGKTFTVAYRFAQRMKTWKSVSSGIATISFTNVAPAQISLELESLGLSPTPPYPHFLGTIDHFINTLIFLPFGHLVMRCSARPCIVGLHNNYWDQDEHRLAWRNTTCYRNGCKLIDFTYDINGLLKGGTNRCQLNKRICLQHKQVFTRNGFANQADAEFWAMRILTIYPGIARSLAKRYPELIIDEAQDTSDIQMRIIDLLVQNGLQHVMLVGDPDQTIYEWRDARPDLFLAKKNSVGWEEPLYLTENRRSSQAICSFTHMFSSTLDREVLSISEDADYHISPILRSYNLANFDALKDDFLNFCQSNSIELNPKNIGILVRTNRHLRIFGNLHEELNIWNHVITKLLCQAAYYKTISQYVEARSYIETAISRLVFGNRFHSRQELMQKTENDIRYPKWKMGIWQLLNLLPDAMISLRDWLGEVNRTIPDWFLSNPWPISDRSQLNFRVKQFTSYKHDNRYTDYFQQPIMHLFSDSKLSFENFTLETVHSAKGKTYEAVLFIVNDNNGRKGTIRQVIENPLDNEEVRTAYVAMSRPKKILVVAVPAETDNNLLRRRFPEAVVQSRIDRLIDLVH